MPVTCNDNLPGFVCYQLLDTLPQRAVAAPHVDAAAPLTRPAKARAVGQHEEAVFHTCTLQLLPVQLHVIVRCMGWGGMWDAREAMLMIKELFVVHNACAVSTELVTCSSGRRPAGCQPRHRSTGAPQLANPM